MAGKGQDLEIVELRIQMHTNMDTQVELTADIIDNKKVSGKYPFLCTNFEYSNDILKQKTQGEIFDIFFNRQKFYNFILASKLKKTQTAVKRYDPKIVKKNIIQMLNALFPISFPINDHVTLMDAKDIDIMDMVTNFFKLNKYTYLKLNKPSTVTQVIWLDTISSNPIFYKIYKKNKDYYKKVLDYAKNTGFLEDNNELTDAANIEDIKKKVKTPYTLNTDSYGSQKITQILKTKEEWILHFLVSNYKKNTKEYNDFIKNYIKTFINSDSNPRYYQYNNSQDQYEKQFYESVPEINFYQKYMIDIVEILPPKRISLETNVSNALKKVKDSNDFTEFVEIYTGTKKNNYCDLIRLDNGAYEIHLGVAVVGGKVNKTNSKFFCNYNSHRLGNDLNYLIRDVEEESEKIRLYGYIDLENVKDANEYVGVINSSIKKKDTENDENAKKQMNYGRWSGGKQSRKRRNQNNKTRKQVS
jgi:hypothetical protein